MRYISIWKKGMRRHIPFFESTLVCHEFSHFVEQCWSKQMTLLFGRNVKFCNNIEKKQTDRALTVQKARPSCDRLPFLANTDQNIRYIWWQATASYFGDLERSIRKHHWPLLGTPLLRLKRNARWNPTRAFVEAIITNSPPTAHVGGLG